MNGKYDIIKPPIHQLNGVLERERERGEAGGLERKLINMTRVETSINL